MVVFTMGFDGKAARAALRRGPDVLKKAIVNSLRSAAVQVVKAAQENLTGGRYGKPVTTTGNLRGSISFQLNTTQLVARVGSFATTYGAAVHDGRKAGKAPPAQALELWVKMKGLASKPSDIKRVAYAIAQKQRHRAVMAKPFLDDAYRARRALILQAFRRRLDEAVAKINKGGK